VTEKGDGKRRMKNEMKKEVHEKCKTCTTETC